MSFSQRKLKIFSALAILLQAYFAMEAAPSVLAAREPSEYAVVGSSRNYGLASGTLQRIDDLLNASGSTISKPEYYDFQSRLYSLRQSALLELSRGEDASTVNQAALKLETEIQSVIKGLGKRAQLETAVRRLEEEFKGRESSFNVEDKIDILGRVETIKNETNKDFLALSDAQIDNILARIRQLQLEMVDKVLFKNRKNNSISTDRDFGDKVHLRDELSKSDSRVRRPETEKTVHTNSTAASPPGKESAAHSLSPASIHHAKKPAPAPPIHKIMERIENELLEYHEKNQIGSFDMDSFTSRLLAQKKNLHVMMSKTGRISLRQETLIRSELEKLQEDISNRILGKD